MTLDPGLLPLAFAVLLLLAALTVPLAAALFFAGALLLALNPAPLPADFLLNYSLAMRLNSPALISVPLFVLAGELAVAAGIARRLLDLADALCGRAGLDAGVRAVVGCTFFATVSAVGPAAAAAEGERLTPALLRAGHTRPFAAGLIACAASLAIVIPTSMPLTLYAATTGLQTNIVFTASFVPGLLLALFLLFAAAVAAPRAGAPAPRRHVRTALAHARWSLPLPLVVLAFLFTGFLTAPEAAAFFCAYAALVGRYAHRALTPNAAWTALARAATGSATVLLMAGMGGLFVMLMDACGFTAGLTDLAFRAGGGRVGSILIMNIILLAAGCFLNMPAVITMVAPLLLPLAAACRMSVPHFGVMVVMNLAIGLVTPPQAWNVSAAARAIGAGLWDTARAASPFLLAMVAALAVVSYLPEVSLWLPRAFGWPV